MKTQLSLNLAHEDTLDPQSSIIQNENTYSDQTVWMRKQLDTFPFTVASLVYSSAGKTLI